MTFAFFLLEEHFWWISAAIKPKDKKSAPLILDQLQGKLILFACVICLPLFVIILGSFVIIRRRIKSTWILEQLEFYLLFWLFLLATIIFLQKIKC